MQSPPISQLSEVAGGSGHYFVMKSSATIYGRSVSGWHRLMPLTTTEGQEERYAAHIPDGKQWGDERLTE